MQKDSEVQIHQAYEKRLRTIKVEFFVYRAFADLLFEQQRHREMLRMLYGYGFHPLNDCHILDVGCGNGNLLRQFMHWGGQPENLCGIELREEALQIACKLSPHLDIRCGNAASLPWPKETFDLVVQSTVITSILDKETRRRVANEMIRVLKPEGAILWYDFMRDNLWNPDVRGVKKAEIQALFPGSAIHLRAITLAPPIARRIPQSLLPMFYPLLSSIPFLRTHYLGLFIKP